MVAVQRRYAHQMVTPSSSIMLAFNVFLIVEIFEKLWEISRRWLGS